jgi:hypothetical protein
METVDCAAGVRYSRAERRRAVKNSLLTIALTVVATFSTNASAQATFETLMTHSISTAVGTHAGTALGRATNALANSVSNRTSTVVPRTNVAPQKTAAQRARATANNGTTPASAFATSTGNGSLIASIQGGERTNSAPACAEKADPAGAPTANCATAADSHPSVVNLPAPK